MRNITDTSPTTVLRVPCSGCAGLVYLCPEDNELTLRHGGPECAWFVRLDPDVLLALLQEPTDVN